MFGARSKHPATNKQSEREPELPKILCSIKNKPRQKSDQIKESTNKILGQLTEIHKMR